MESSNNGHKNGVNTEKVMPRTKKGPGHYEVKCDGCGEVFAFSSRVVNWKMHCDVCSGIDRKNLPKAAINAANQIRKNQYMILPEDAKQGARIPLYDEDGKPRFTSKPEKMFERDGMTIFGINPNDFVVNQEGEKVFLIEKDGEIRIIDEDGNTPKQIGEVQGVRLFALTKEHHIIDNKDTGFMDDDEKIMLLDANGEVNFYSEPIAEGEREDKSLGKMVIDFLFGDPDEEDEEDGQKEEPQAGDEPDPKPDDKDYIV